MVLLSITPLLDGVLRRDIIAPFHTSGPPLLQFHLAIEQWGFCGTGTINLPISFVEQIFICIVTDMTSSVNNSDGYFSWNPDKSAISSILITSSSGAGGGNYIVIGF